MQQLQKSLLQRQLEHLHAMLLEIELPTVSSAANQKAQDRNLHDEVMRNMEMTRTELAKQTAKTAKLSHDFELLQMAVSRIQSRLDELNRQSIQIEFPQVDGRNSESPARK